MIDVLLQTVNKKRGAHMILQQIDLSIPQGQTVALLGPNGSGKTTLLNLITGLQQPSSGQVRVGRSRAGNPQGLQQIAYLPETSALHEWMTVGQMIDYYQNFYPDVTEDQLEKLLSLMQLERHQLIGQLSHGMKRRLGIALIMSRRAQVVLLDEPFQGVDPLSRAKIFRAIIREHAFGEATLIISTHMIEDVERLVERVLLLKEGQIALDTQLEEWQLAHGRSLPDLYREVYEA